MAPHGRRVVHRSTSGSILTRADVNFRRLVRCCENLAKSWLRPATVGDDPDSVCQRQADFIRFSKYLSHLQKLLDSMPLSEDGVADDAIDESSCVRTGVTRSALLLEYARQIKRLTGLVDLNRLALFNILGSQSVLTGALTQSQSTQELNAHRKACHRERRWTRTALLGDVKQIYNTDADPWIVNSRLLAPNGVRGGEALQDRASCRTQGIDAGKRVIRDLNHRSSSALLRRKALKEARVAKREVHEANRIHEEIMTDMLGMTDVLKHNVRGMRDQLAISSSHIENVASNVDTQLNNTVRENKRLKLHMNSSSSSMWYAWGILVVVALLWIGTFIMMRIFSKRRT